MKKIAKKLNLNKGFISSLNKTNLNHIIGGEDSVDEQTCNGEDGCGFPAVDTEDGAGCNDPNNTASTCDSHDCFETFWGTCAETCNDDNSWAFDCDDGKE